MNIILATILLFLSFCFASFFIYKSKIKKKKEKYFSEERLEVEKTPYRTLGDTTLGANPCANPDNKKFKTAAEIRKMSEGEVVDVNFNKLLRSIEIQAKTRKTSMFYETENLATAKYLVKFLTEKGYKSHIASGTEIFISWVY